MSRRLRIVVLSVVMALATWAAASLFEVPPLDRPLSEDSADRWLLGLGIPAVALYALAAWRYQRLYRHRPSAVLLGVTAAWILLGEAAIAVAFSRNWHASWWEWHLLMAAAFGLVAYTALRERARGEFFAGLYLDGNAGPDRQGLHDRRQGRGIRATRPGGAPPPLRARSGRGRGS